MLSAPAYFAHKAIARPRRQALRRTTQGCAAGQPGRGGPLPGLGPAELNFFNAALARFREVNLRLGNDKRCARRHAKWAAA